ncbi:hypothetical protein [Sporosarcina gallistercoris]|uniref:Uncharacterized protein n=1 Tax=Sporosarcina gallistercoris TaxID=2762245 RepID=A0ABR8PJ53_9BACL|nr:hypothetical protein [Sporosarcina gallistercoris]MBD7908188.1 hypothetical protein [Sporosarcina gallistercoris]
MLGRKDKDVSKVQEPEEGVDNIYAAMPPVGVILEEATEEEMEKAADLEIRHIAFMRLQEMNIQFDGSSYKDLLKDFKEFEKDSSDFWRGVSVRLSVPYEWPIRIDHALGIIYMGEHEYGEEEEE